MELILGYLTLTNIGIALGALDIILGSLPDKYVRYPGIFLSMCHKLHQYGKEQKEIYNK